MASKSTKEAFINKAMLIHGDKYNYSDVEYNGNKIPVKINCLIHGEFLQRPNDHLSSNGCSKCSNKFRLDTNTFIEKAKEVHGNKYDYSSVDYINTKTNVKIICLKHGTFYQTPDSHINSKNGCRKCNGTLTNEEFISLAKEVHGDKYNYSSVNYIDFKTNVDITCKIHGVFSKRPAAHISSGEGCRLCWVDENVLNFDKFITKSKQIHGEKYQYDKSSFINSWTKTIITCPNHGQFNQRPNDHIRGNGCPICRESNGERLIRIFLDRNKIDYIREYIFPECKDKMPLPFDFYLPKHNICVEYNGIQHYQPVSFFGGIQSLTEQQRRDLIKFNYCGNNNIDLIVIKSLNENLENIFINLLKKKENA